MARLAGLPEEVLSRASTIVQSLNESDIAAVSDKITMQEQLEEKLKSMESFTVSKHDTEILTAIRDLDITKITPLEAMNILYDFHEKVNE